MKKIISILIAVAMLASLTVIAITSVSAAEETVYSVPLTDQLACKEANRRIF